MYFDALTLAAVRDEFRATVLGGRVQKTLHPGLLALGLEVYARGQTYWVYASAQAQDARVHLVEGKLARASDEVTPFLLLVRKYVRGGRIIEIEQPKLERVLILHVQRRDPDTGAQWETRLIFEIMGRHSNMILVDGAGLVLDSLKRVTPEMSRQRPMLPGVEYRLPPPQAGKLSPLELSASRLRTAVALQPGHMPLWQALVAGVLGTSPLAAQEAACRATGSPFTTLADVHNWEAVVDALAALWAPVRGTAAWQPCTGLEQGRVITYAPYELTHYPERRCVESISAAVEAFHGEQERTEPYSPWKALLHQTIDRQIDRVERRRASLQRALAEAAQSERLRRAGELLLMYSAGMCKGQREVVLEGERIVLNPALTAMENAQEYFKEYSKARRAVADVPAMLEAAGHELAYLREQQVLLELAASPAELSEVEADLVERGVLSAPERKKPAPRRKQQGNGRQSPLPPRQFLIDGFEVLAGRSARQNHVVTFDLASPHDIWLHARGVPGAHVIVRSGGRSVPEHVLRRAAAIAAHFSQSRTASSVAVDYTMRRYVRPIKGAAPGLVTYSHETTVHVHPEPPPAV
jgi:predicted ribosome quality control (RQC) complex YloA/Tae2 family protein